MMRVLMAGALLVAGVGAFLQTQGTFANLQDTEAAAGSFEAWIEDNGTADPGHAYEDTNNDGLFTEGVDLAIADPDIRDGHHVASDPGHGLVVPRSVGTLEPQGPIHLAAGDQGHLIVQVKLETPDAIELRAGTQAKLQGLVAEAIGAMAIHGGTGVLLHGSTLAAGDRLTVTSDQGLVSLNAANAEADGPVQVTAGGDLTTEDARIEAIGAIDLTAGGDAYVKRATLETDGDLAITAGSVQATIFVEGARFMDANDTAQAAPAGVEIVGTPAEGEITYQG